GVTGALTITSGSSATLNSDTGEVDINGTVFRGPGAGTINGINLRANTSSTANVLEVQSMDIAATATFRVRGTSAIILLSDSTVHIGGLVDVSASCSDGGMSCPGPGGGVGSGPLNFAAGCGPGGDGNLGSDCNFNPESAGGGGGGLGATGANGGNTINTNCTPTTCCDKLDGGPAGVACGTAPLVPLVGGSGGGASANSGGGGGGGALQITAMQQLTMDQSAAINAAGGGGQGARQDRFGVYQSGGGGGGSGGAVLLESPTLSIGSGVIIAANGGGGGSGDTPGAGQAGQLSITSAALGGCDAGCQDVGGNGGVGSSPPTGGIAVGAHVASGGGGAVGRIRLNATTLTTTGAQFSPAPSTGQPVYQ
ncbi:MAG TPA: hypothetical protein VH208_11670, partial [Myxococcaceae bacterium]|nr:hypothetical protein [Myxococcaceae bacterium]